MFCRLQQAAVDHPWPSGKFRGRVRVHYALPVVNAYLDCGEPRLARVAAARFAAHGMTVTGTTAAQLAKALAGKVPQPAKDRRKVALGRAASSSRGPSGY